VQPFEQVPAKRADFLPGGRAAGEAAGLLSGQLPGEPTESRVEELFQQLSSYDVDFADVRGQELAKRAVVVAASGGDNVVMI
jgi:magnesium chelatase family protein